MTDIVERLRKAGLRDGFAVILYQHVQQAADEIERLRVALASLQNATMYKDHPAESQLAIDVLAATK